MEKIVKIKSWKSMKDKFGVNNNTGSIKCGFSFTRDMENAMPKDRIIEIFNHPSSSWTWAPSGKRCFLISTDMIEKEIADLELEYKKINLGIRAEVMFEWDRDKNKNCRFIPGEKARVRNVHTYRNSKVCNSYIGEEGTIVAVTTPGLGLIRGLGRMYTKYYIQFNDNHVQGFLSGDLLSVNNKEDEYCSIAPGKFGQCYTTYTEMVNLFNLKYFKYNTSIPKDSDVVYKILGREEHLKHYCHMIVVALRDEVNMIDYLISESAIVKRDKPVIETPQYCEFISQIEVLTDKNKMLAEENQILKAKLNAVDNIING